MSFEFERLCDKGSFEIESGQVSAIEETQKLLSIASLGQLIDFDRSIQSMLDDCLPYLQSRNGAEGKGVCIKDDQEHDSKINKVVFSYIFYKIAREMKIFDAQDKQTEHQDDQGSKNSLLQPLLNSDNQIG